MSFCQFQHLSIGSYFKLLNQEDVYQKVKLISDMQSDYFDTQFFWKTLAINTDSGMGCYLKDDRVIRKIDLAQAICV
jgi:hypothetical protein